MHGHTKIHKNSRKYPHSWSPSPIILEVKAVLFPEMNCLWWFSKSFRCVFLHCSENTLFRSTLVINLHIRKSKPSYWILENQGGVPYICTMHLLYMVYPPKKPNRLCLHPVLTLDSDALKTTLNYSKKTLPSLKQTTNAPENEWFENDLIRLPFGRKGLFSGVNKLLVLGKGTPYQIFKPIIVVRWQGE